MHLDRLGVADDFAVVVTGDDGLPPKPAPALYLRALAALGVSASEALAFEDSPTGVRAAAAAGVRCVAVPSEAGPRSELEAADDRPGARVSANARTGAHGRDRPGESGLSAGPPQRRRGSRGVGCPV
jgi:beta-phosphoglucomutase-like phosphatase (HAD superfamily)